MQITRIELEGDAGHLAIEREPGSATLRIDSIIHDPAPGTAPGKDQQARKTWQLSARVGDEELFRVAAEVQRRTDGCAGTNSMIHDYLRELQRFVG